MAKAKNVCVVYRPQSQKALDTANDLVKWLTERKISVFNHPEFKLKNSKPAGPNEIKNLDLVIVLGGDGTFLSAARLLDGNPVPVLGVNLGSLGFLTETRVEELYDVAEMALEGKMQQVPRAMLSAIVENKDGKKECYSALNDVVLERGPNSRLIDILIYSNEFFVSNVKADGLIVASPTGTTAYCLAAGGPIVHPDVEGITITPICPHTLTNRPIILPDDRKIRLKLSEESHRAVLMIDGRRCEDLNGNQELTITKGKHPVIMLTLPKRNYFDVLRSKLRFGQRE